MNEEKKMDTLQIDYTNYETNLSVNYKRRKKYVKPNPKQILAFIPGTIPELMVKPGDMVREGDHLLILEAMKMMNTIKAPFDGRISRVNVKVGDRVAKSDLLIEFE